MKNALPAFGFTFLFYCTIARAEIAVAPTLEWLADHCIDSAVYVVSDVQSKQNDTLSLGLMLKRALRGEPAQEIKEDYWGTHRTDPERASAKEGDEFLIFFQHYEDGSKRVVQIINLDNPATAGSKIIAASCDVKLLKTKNEILKVFEERLKSNPKADPVVINDYSKDNRLKLEYDDSAELSFAMGCAFDGCYLRVPFDLIDKVKTKSRIKPN